MKFRPVILFPIAAVLIALIYAFGETRIKPKQADKPGNQPGANTVHIEEKHDHSAQFDYVLTRAKSRLDQSQQDSINLLTKQAEASTKPEEKAAAFKKLGSYWMQTGNLITAGHYHSLAADAAPQDKEQRQLAARMLAMAMNGAADSTARAFAVHQAVHQYEELVKLDSADTQAKIELAMVYVESGTETMKGVFLLRDIEKIEPDNETVNLTLGRLAVTSGQFDKAITRLEKLTQNHPDNAEAYIHLAEAYRAVGQKDKALRALEKCKQLVKESPEAVKQVEQIITSIKNS